VMIAKYERIYHRLIGVDATVPEFETRESAVGR
jgi:hypothetical protein